MNKRLVILLVVSTIAIAVATAGFVMLKPKNTKPEPPTGGPVHTMSTSSGLSSDSMTPEFMINANDESADHESMSVKKGAHVSLMFMVEKEGVYHGGLQFKSSDPQIDTGPIAPGSDKTVTFTADHNFSFTPYWYASGVKKDYLITVNVNS